MMNYKREKRNQGTAHFDVLKHIKTGYPIELAGNSPKLILMGTRSSRFDSMRQPCTLSDQFIQIVFRERNRASERPAEVTLSATSG
jgi:hypothetical protein